MKGSKLGDKDDPNVKPELIIGDANDTSMEGIMAAVEGLLMVKACPRSSAPNAKPELSANGVLMEATEGL